ncbi:hypothetical protein H0H92_007389 [Tricholoma furcatifolium]|nr:hypothetical protein H0H92_007389 [Tricholoma furcatifolium]
MVPLDPLLIGSFPAPPTHIPATPTSPNNNPPLSRPPSSPLPPLPGSSSSSRFLFPPRKPHHRSNDSISEIDVRDILDADVTTDEDDDVLAALPPLSRTPRAASFPANVQATPSSAPTPINKPKRSFTLPTPATARSASPDIPSIISSTPRPRATSLHKSKSRSNLKHNISSLSSSSARSVRSYGSLSAAAQSFTNNTNNANNNNNDDFDVDAPASDEDDTRSWIDHDEYGKPIPVPTHSLRKSKSKSKFKALPLTLPDEDEESLVRLERQLEVSEEEGDTDASDDSSLDLHTPLPRRSSVAGKVLLRMRPRNPRTHSKTRGTPQSAACATATARCSRAASASPPASAGATGQ